MIILGIIALVLGALLGISVLYYVGGVLLVVGLVLLLLGTVAHRPVLGRSHWF